MFSRETPNKSIGRSGQKPEAVVVHITGGTFQSAKNWIYNPIALASYHYVISRNGKLLRAVKEENTAWHAGRITNPKWTLLKTGLNPNLYTIGIAFAGRVDEKPTILQFFTAAYLLQRFKKQFGIAIDKNHIIPHNWINGAKECPGPNLDIDFLIYLANLPLTG